MSSSYKKAVIDRLEFSAKGKHLHVYNTNPSGKGYGRIVLTSVSTCGVMSYVPYRAKNGKHYCIKDNTFFEAAFLMLQKN